MLGSFYFKKRINTVTSFKYITILRAHYRVMLPNKDDNNNNNNNNQIQSNSSENENERGMKFSDIYSLERPKDVVSGVTDVSYSLTLTHFLN